MRSRVTRDGKKLIISTTDGYLMAVHNLDLNHLGRDLFGFNASHYHEHWYRSNPPKPLDDMFRDLFTAKRNRIEYIDDFPMEDEPNMVPSLEVVYHSCAVKPMLTQSPVGDHTTVISMSVCLSAAVHVNISGNTCPNLTRFSLHVTCDCDFVLLWQLCYKLSYFRFCRYVTVARNGQQQAMHSGVSSKSLTRGQHWIRAESDVCDCLVAFSRKHFL